MPITQTAALIDPVLASKAIWILVKFLLSVALSLTILKYLWNFIDENSRMQHRLV